MTGGSRMRTIREHERKEGIGSSCPDDRAVLQKETRSGKGNALPRLRRVVRVCTISEKQMPVGRCETVLFQLQNTLLSTGNAAKNRRGHAFFRPADAVASSPYRS